MNSLESDYEAFIGLVLVALSFIATNVLFVWATPLGFAAARGVGVDEFFDAATWLGSIAFVQMILAARYGLSWAAFHGGVVLALTILYAWTFATFA